MALAIGPESCILGGLMDNGTRSERHGLLIVGNVESVISSATLLLISRAAFGDGEV